MYNFKTEIGNFTLPSSYSDLKVKDLKFIETHSDVEILEYITGLDIVKLSMIDLSQIGNYLDFLKQPLTELERVDFIGNSDLSFDFGERSFGEKIKATQHLKDNEPFEMLKVYAGEMDLENLSIAEVFGAVNYVAEKLAQIDKERNSMLHYIPTIEEKMAGIDNFDKLGEFNTIDFIAKNYNYTHKQVEELEYNVVILILYRSKIQSNFEKKLHEQRRNT
jgi:hypothetical protein